MRTRIGIRVRIRIRIRIKVRTVRVMTIHFRHLSFPPDFARFHWPKAAIFKSIGLDSQTLSFAIAGG